MPFKVITIPFAADQESFLNEELNRFCLSRKIVDRQPQFFVVGGRAYWTVFIEYEEVLPPEKEKDNFTEAEKLLYHRLREWRKQSAEQAGLPVYVIATNGELADLVRKGPRTLEALKAVRGFGQKKVERYGKALIELIEGFYTVQA